MYPIRGTCCLSVYPDLLLECVLMDSAFNGKSIVKSISSPHMLRHSHCTYPHLFFTHRFN